MKCEATFFVCFWLAGFIGLFFGGGLAVLEILDILEFLEFLEFLDIPGFPDILKIFDDFAFPCSVACSVFP